MLRHLAAVATALLAAVPATSAVLEFTGQTINEGPGPTPGGRCELPALTFTMGPEAGPVTGTSNLGDFAPRQSHCTVPGPGATFADGLFDFGNGTILSGTYVGTTFPTDTMGLIGFDQLFTITGGSGLFAGATGGFTGEGTIEIRPGQNALGIASLSGSINLLPEPAGLGLFGIGIGLIALRGRRKSRAAPGQR
jgi:hypothetical protein